MEALLIIFLNISTMLNVTPSSDDYGTKETIPSLS